jgi:CDP-diacylglycerol--glycerol-3-phosphate 3-phosphatidyltransferase
MSFMKLRFVLTVPNILTGVRLLAIPVLARLILAGDACNTVAFVLFLTIWMTDLLDGYLARRLNQVTEFGKLFDPLVDKIFQLTTAVMMFLVGKLPLWVPLFILTKELLMIIGGAVLFKKKAFVVTAAWYGKLATFLFVLAFAGLFLLPRDQQLWAHLIFVPPVAWSLYAYYRYGIDFLKMNPGFGRRTDRT